MLAFLVGAVAGAAVALLYAPATGRETREFLGEKAREGRERATEAAAKGTRSRSIAAARRWRRLSNAAARRTSRPALRHPPREKARERLAEIFLGVIAVATLSMAIVLVGALVAASRLARRVGRILDQLEVDLKPLLRSSERHRPRRLAGGRPRARAQVERVDRVLTDLALRLDQTVRSVQAILDGPAREGRAVVTRAGRGAPRHARRARRGTPAAKTRTRSSFDRT